MDNLLEFAEWIKWNYPDKMGGLLYLDGLVRLIEEFAEYKRIQEEIDNGYPRY